MSKSVSLDIPQALLWLLRVAADPAVGLHLQIDPVAFAGWYAVVGEAIDWPEEVVAIQQAERNRKLSLDRMMKLLSQVNYTFAGRTSAEHARRVLEGYAVHDWVRSHGQAFREQVKQREEDFAFLERPSSSRSALNDSGFASNLKSLGEALDLSELERSILAFAFVSTASSEFSGIFEQLATDRWTADRVWSVVFKTTREELAKAMRPDSALRLTGMLRASGRHVQLAQVSPFWIELMADAHELFDAVLEPYEFKLGSGMPARLSDEDRQLACEVLKNASEPGVNLLLYGASSLEKRTLVRDLVRESGRKAWRVRKFEDVNRQDLPALGFLAFRLLNKVQEPSLLVVEAPDTMLHPVPGEFIRMLFGIELENRDIEPFDEHLLKSNSVPGLWLANNVASMQDETVARFVFHAPLKKANKEERLAQMRERLAGLKLNKQAMEEVLKLEGVSAAQLESAVRAARLSGAKTKKERDAALVQAVRRSQRALSRDLQAKMKPSVTQYSLKYLNTAGRFGPVEILDCLKRNPKGTMVLYGPPGTGKTQFVEHMAAELGMPLVTKRASDLLSKWLGESEKNIAAAFEEAASEDAILFLDEGDSFLRDRQLADKSWEVTQVNELLQHMERFDGIFVVSTNLFRGLDAAALRRFTFKVEFQALDADQRWEMFVNETGLKGQLGTIEKTVREEWWERLVFMRQLTPGDFATVKRQCTLLGTTLTPEQWLEQLKIECDVKSTSKDDRTMH